MSQQFWFLFILNLLQSSHRTDVRAWFLYSNIERQQDCYVIDFRYYCKKSNDGYLRSNIHRTCINGDSWSFSELQKNRVTTDNLIRWFIPFDLVEQYASYLDDNQLLVTGHQLICNCSVNFVGRLCQYQLPKVKTTVADQLNTQQARPSSMNQESLTVLDEEKFCDTPMPILEWRHICDGKIHCPNRYDEVNCHLLEFHQCESDEFQCRNGMCIPVEFAFDAMPDCMDASDEQELDEINKLYYKCKDGNSIDCDERLCRKDQFSCGNGECVSWSSLLNPLQGCSNFRHVAYLCETIDFLYSIQSPWTGICNETIRTLPPLSNASDCLTSLRHLLNVRSTVKTDRTRELAFNNTRAQCPELIHYSDFHMLSANLKTFHNRTRIELFYKNRTNFHQPLPRAIDLYCFSGAMICHDRWKNIPDNHCMDSSKFQELLSYPFLPFSHLFCEWAISSPSSSSSGSSIASDKQDTFSSLERYLCRNTSDFLSLRRLNDGYIDCLYGDDERNSNYTRKFPFRYQCETLSSPVQYVSYTKLGNGVEDCADGSDEIGRHVRWSSFKCSINDNYACWALQGDGIDENRIKDARLAFHRYCDTVWDTIDGQDERDCLLWVCADGLYRCNRTGQCIEQSYFCDGEFDCDDGEDELNCSPRAKRWILESSCNRSHEHFCITDHYRKDQTMHRPCIPYTLAGDHHVDCIGARDERNVLSCPDHRAIGDRFMCDNQTKCINHQWICNGIDDCDDKTDETICYWYTGGCDVGFFPCAFARGCRPQRCDGYATCTNGSHWFWCPNSTRANGSYRPSKYERMLPLEESCYKQKIVRRTPTVLNLSMDRSAPSKAATEPIAHGYCNHGFYLNLIEERERHCYCAFTFHGERCQFHSRRVTVRVRFYRRHRSDVPIVLNVLVTLVLNGSRIIDHQSFVDEDKEYPSKKNTYLFYSYPKLAGFYNVRIEAYHSTDFIAFWQYSVSPLDFLPTFRISKILHFPDRSLPWKCLYNHCHNNGTCYHGNNDQYLCLCSRHWKGRLCEIRTDYVYCAANSLARTESICVCPYGYLEPLCFVRNSICEQKPSCPPKETCYALSIPNPNRYICVCNTSDCGHAKPMITVHRASSNRSPGLLQLLQLSADYPRLRQQILIDSLTLFPLIQSIKIRNGNGVMGELPEMGLFFIFQRDLHSVDSKLHLLFINCSKLYRNYTIDLDRQPQRCRVLNETESHFVTRFHSFCSLLTNDSFFTSEHYFCYCDSTVPNRSECLAYKSLYNTCIYCYNEGLCLQGSLRNRSDFTCICPQCATGELCQYSLNRFSISLEFLIDKTNWNQYHLIGPTFFAFIGLIFNGFGFLTFIQRKFRQSGTGLYLLFNSILSQLLLTCLCARVVYLYVSRRILIPLHINRGLCKSLPILMSSLYYITLWLMAFVNVERSLAVVRPSWWSCFRKATSAVILTVMTSIVIISSSYVDLEQYQLASHPNSIFPWCVRETKGQQKVLTQYLTLFHQVIPFLINIITAVTIIFALSRSKAHAHQIKTHRSLAQQTRKRLDLLLGPIACFAAQMPQILILFLNPCHYDDASWFVQLTVAIYYVSFTPQISLFFLYVLPSPVYKGAFVQNIRAGKFFVRMFVSIENTFR